MHVGINRDQSLFPAFSENTCLNWQVQQLHLPSLKIEQVPGTCMYNCECGKSLFEKLVQL